MAETKEPEQILREVFDLLAQLEKVKVKGERPIPIVQDRQGRLAKDSTLKEWLNKITEEIDELKEELFLVYTLEDVPSRCCLRYERKKLIVGEMCDVIEVLYSMANQMGIDGDMIQQGIAETNKKLRERGCI